MSRLFWKCTTLFNTNLSCAAHCYIREQISKLHVLAKKPCNSLHHSFTLHLNLPFISRVRGFEPEVFSGFDLNRQYSQTPIKHSRVLSYFKLLRIDKPIGTLLLLWPCTWGITLATLPGDLPNAYLLGLFALGSFVMRGSGCIINDMLDKDIDRKVERTMLRPLASGELSSTQAFSFLALNLGIALTILLQLNLYSIELGISALALVIVYPLMKRVTYWPQLTLGFAFNFGILMGWSAVHGSIYWPTVLPLYMSGIMWTLVYDTIYAHQDKLDDKQIGVKSTALLFGYKTKQWLTAFSGLMLTGLLTTGYTSGQLWPYYAAVGFTASHLAYQIIRVDLDNPSDCGSKFRSNSWIGAAIFMGLLGTAILRKWNPENITCDQPTESRVKQQYDAA